MEKCFRNTRKASHQVADGNDGNGTGALCALRNLKSEQ